MRTVKLLLPALALMCLGLAGCNNEKPEDKPGEPQKITFTATKASFTESEDFAEITLENTAGDKTYIKFYPAESGNSYTVARATTAGTIYGADGTETSGASWYKAKAGSKENFMKAGTLTITIDKDAKKLSVSGKTDLLNDDELTVAAADLVYGTTPIVDKVDFTAATGTYTSGDKSWDVTLKDDSDGEVFLKVYYTADTDGKYPINTSATAGSILGATAESSTGASYYKKGDAKYFLASGDIDISFDGDDQNFILSFSGEATSLEGTVINITAEEIELPELKVYELTTGEIMYYWENKDEYPELEENTSFFYLYLKDFDSPNMTFSFSAYISTTAMEDISVDKLYIPTGIYRPTAGTFEAFTFNNSEASSMKTNWWTVDPIENIVVKDGFIDIKKVGSNYTIRGEVYSDTGVGIIFTFSGPLPMSRPYLD